MMTVFVLASCQVPAFSSLDSSLVSSEVSSLEVVSSSSTNGTNTSEPTFSSESSLPSSTTLTSSEPSAPLLPYYQAIDRTETGMDLQQSLRTLITQTHMVETTYSGLATVFPKSDLDPAKSGHILWFYSGTSVKFSGFGGSNGQTNREHVWPKDGGKAFPEQVKAGSDAHHLRPTETQLNSIRGNKSFGVVPQTSANIAKQNGVTNYATGDALSYVNSTYFYPGKGYRGQTARILFYVQVRWGAAYQLRFVLGPGTSKTIGDMETLMTWHLQEPVSSLEHTRNEEVYRIQGNRNPFIDDPEFACQIYAHDGQAYASTVAQVCQA